MEKGSEAKPTPNLLIPLTLKSLTVPYYGAKLDLMASSGSKRKFDSSRTRLTAFRISHTHHGLLNDPKFKSRSSALVRVLLGMYFNGRIPEADLLLEHEIKRATEAVSKHNGVNVKKGDR